MDIYFEFDKLKKENEKLIADNKEFKEKIQLAILSINAVLTVGYYEHIEIVLKDILKELENGFPESGRTKRMKSVAEEFIIDENETPKNMQEIIAALRPKN